MTSSDGKSQHRVMQRAALYLRVSTARQAEHDVSIPDQKRQGEAYCASRGYVKRLEAGKFIWPVSQNGAAVPVSAVQLGYLLEGIDWRNLRWTQRPASVG